jgi:thioredoxin-like negative regulator of GroEL
MKKILLTLVAALFMGTGLMAQNATMPQNITLRTIDGQSVPSSVIQNDGRPVIVSFWATWCKPCNR